MSLKKNHNCPIIKKHNENNPEGGIDLMIFQGLIICTDAKSSRNIKASNQSHDPDFF